MQYGFGVDLGGTTVKLAFFDRQGQMLDKWEIPTRKENNGENILPDIAASALGYLQKKNIPCADVLGIGIGVPGVVREDGVVNRCVNLGWGVFNVKEVLGSLTGMNIAVGNDASVAALGECWKGGGQGCKDMVMVTLGTGVGGGIVANGKVLFGAHGAGGEIGHMVINRQEMEVCGCGKRGCVEQYCSATGIVRLVKKMQKETRISCCLRDREFTCKDVFDAAAQGDMVCMFVLEKVYKYLGEFLANLCCATDPERFVFGGGVSKAGKPLLDGVRNYFTQYAFHAHQDVEFTLATLGNDAGAYGAFKLLLDAE